MQALFQFLNHPVTTIAVGVLLLVAGILELIEELFGPVTGIRVHHALIVFGVYMALQGLMTALAGSRRRRFEQAARAGASDALPGALVVEGVTRVDPALGDEESVAVMRPTGSDPIDEPWRPGAADRPPAAPGPGFGAETPSRQ